MHPAPDQSDPLRRLLQLKRHESPPPGYFERLPGQIIDQLRAGETPGPVSRWQAWLENWDFQPVLAYAYGLAVAGLMVFGLGLSAVLDDPRDNARETGGQYLALVPAAASSEPVEWRPAVPFASYHGTVSLPPSSVGPVTSIGASALHGTRHGASVVPASFVVGGR
jgi:hypothetical protein